MQNLEFIERWMSLQVGRTGLPAISFAASAEGIAQAFSCSSATAGSRSDGLLFDVASQTKVALVQALLVLKERGQVDLDTALPACLGHLDLPLSLGNKSILDLMTHSAGLPRDTVVPLPAEEPEALIQRTLKTVSMGSVHRYSNVGFMMLGLIIESLTDSVLENALVELVIGPLQMETTHWHANVGELDKAVPHGSLTGGRYRPIEMSPAPTPGATGLWSTPLDMCRLFGHFLTKGSGPLSLGARDFATTTQWMGATAELAVGMEVYNFTGRRWLGHTGGAPGFLSGTFCCDELDVVFSIAMNAQDSTAFEGCVKTAALLMSMGGVSDSAPDVEGRYENPLGYIEIVSIGGQLTMVDPAQWDLFRRSLKMDRRDQDTLVVQGDDFNSAGSQLRLLRDTTGKVVGLERGAFEFRRT